MEDQRILMMAKYTAYWTLTVVLGFGLCMLAVPRNAHSDVYHGTVVDAESGEPLADAVLVVVWWTRPYFTGFERPREFHQAKEAVTDSNGKFSLDVSPAISWNPFTYVESPPTIIIYKPGYRPLINATRVAMGFPKITDVPDALRDGVVVRLAKPESREEAMRYTGVSSLTGVEVPMESVPNLTRLVNIQRKLVGLTSFFPEAKKGEKLP